MHWIGCFFLGYVLFPELCFVPELSFVSIDVLCFFDELRFHFCHPREHVTKIGTPFLLAQHHVMDGRWRSTFTLTKRTCLPFGPSLIRWKEFCLNYPKITASKKKKKNSSQRDQNPSGWSKDWSVFLSLWVQWLPCNSNWLFPNPAQFKENWKPFSISTVQKEEHNSKSWKFKGISWKSTHTQESGWERCLEALNLSCGVCVWRTSVRVCVCWRGLWFRNILFAGLVGTNCGSPLLPLQVSEQVPPAKFKKVIPSKNPSEFSDSQKSVQINAWKIYMWFP